jgi:Zn-dependent protease
MKRNLIKIILVLLVVYGFGYLSAKYSVYVSSTFKYSLAIDLLFRIIPGLLCGLIIGVESMFPLAKVKSRKIDPRYMLLSLLLVGLAIYPFLIYLFPITVHVSALQINKIMMSDTFGLMASFLAGYSLTQIYSSKR